MVLVLMLMQWCGQKAQSEQGGKCREPAPSAGTAAVSSQEDEGPCVRRGRASCWTLFLSFEVSLFFLGKLSVANICLLLQNT